MQQILLLWLAIKQCLLEFFQRGTQTKHVASNTINKSVIKCIHNSPQIISYVCLYVRSLFTKLTFLWLVKKPCYTLSVDNTCAVLGFISG